MSTSDSITGAESTSRELASRDGDCVHVLWHPQDDAVTISIEDTRAGQRFEFAVDGDRALNAFYHPFAYAA